MWYPGESGARHMLDGKVITHHAKPEALDLNGQFLEVFVAEERY